MKTRLLSVLMLFVMLIVVTWWGAGNSSLLASDKQLGEVPTILAEESASALLQAKIVPVEISEQFDFSDMPPQYPARTSGSQTLIGSIAFESDRGGNFDIFSQEADGSESAVPLVTGNGDDFTPVWSPDGTQLVFASNRDGDFEIYLLNTANQVTQLTSNTFDDAHPAWSPDGSRIIFTSNRSGSYFQIYTMRADGSDVQQIGIVPGNNAMHPRYSPDGSRIVFMRASVTDPICTWNWDIWVMEASGNNQQRVTTQIGADLYPNWTPDGTEIVYASCRNFLDFDLYRTNPNTGAEFQLTSWFLSNEWAATYTPDSLHIAFNSDIDGNAEIYTAPVNGGAASNLTQHAAEDVAASWKDLGGKISGRIVDNHNNPIPGVTVSTDLGATGTTNLTGEYAINGIGPGNYTVTAAKRGYSFTPASRVVAVPPDATEQNFSGTAVCNNQWYSEYYNNEDLQGSPVHTQCAPNIDSYWGTGSPNSLVRSDNFSARWSRVVQIPESGWYRFRTLTDDGIRLYIDGNRVIDDWTAGSFHEKATLQQLEPAIRNMELPRGEGGKIRSVLYDIK